MKRLLLVLVAASVCACSQQKLVGSRWVRDEAVSATLGATVEAGADAAALAGASLRIGAFDLRADTTITLEEGTTALATEPPPAGPVAVWGPEDAAFARPVLMALPFSLRAGQSTSDLLVVGVTKTAVIRLPHAALAIDAAAQVVRFEVERLGAFQAAAVVRCTGDAQCGAGQACHNHECHTLDGGPGDADGGGLDGGAVDGGAAPDAGHEPDAGHP